MLNILIPKHAAFNLFQNKRKYGNSKDKTKSQNVLIYNDSANEKRSNIINQQVYYLYKNKLHPKTNIESHFINTHNLRPCQPSVRPVHLMDVVVLYVKR